MYRYICFIVALFFLCSCFEEADFSSKDNPVEEIVYEPGSVKYCEDRYEINIEDTYWSSSLDDNSILKRDICKQMSATLYEKDYIGACDKVYLSSEEKDKFYLETKVSGFYTLFWAKVYACSFRIGVSYEAIFNDVPTYVLDSCACKKVDDGYNYRSYKNYSF